MVHKSDVLRGKTVPLPEPPAVKRLGGVRGARGPPANLFVDPDVEVNGRPYEKFGKKFSFRDLLAPGTAGGR